LLAENPELLQAHLEMLPDDELGRRGDFDNDIALAAAKVETAASRQEAIDLFTTTELMVALSSRALLRRLISKEA
jgi:hypothetical protein